MATSIHTEVTGVILCGGQSRRFGQDKAEAFLNGAPLIEKAASKLSSVLNEVVLASGPASRTYDVPLEHIPDTLPDAGPLAGISAAFAATTSDHLLVLAVDLPLVSRDTLVALLAQPSGRPVLVRAAPSTVQPLCGLWPRNLAHEIEKYLRNGGRSVFGFLDTHPFQTIDIPEAELVNINRPGDVSGKI